MGALSRGAVLIALVALLASFCWQGSVTYRDPRHRQGADPHLIRHASASSLSCLNALPITNVCAVASASVRPTDPEGAILRLSHLLKLRTVSDPQADRHVRHPEEFSRAHKHLEASYPDVWRHMAVETVNSIPSSKACTSFWAQL